MKDKILRIVLIVLGVIGAMLFTLPILTGTSLNLGNLTGLGVSALFLLVGLGYSLCKKGIAFLWKKRIGKVVVSLSALFASAIVVLVLIESGCMIYAANQKPTDNATVVVLGCRVYGERASLSLVERMDAAYEFLEENPDANCIVSGGQGSGEDISEAECMYRYLINKGIAKERIYIEDKSLSTRENLKFSYDIIKAEGLSENVAIATSEYHVYRASLVAGKLGMKTTAIPGKTAWWLFPTNYVRELYGILYQWLGMSH